MRPTSRHLLSLATASALLACSGVPGDLARDGSERTGAASAPIINGMPATDYPESALLDMTQTGSPYSGSCSGALIAPQVVLTAGHCVKGVMTTAQTFIPDTWNIGLPYNGNQHFVSTSAATYDWQTGGEMPDPTQHDVGLVFLPTPANVTMAQCPSLATTALASGAQVINLGRIQGGQVTSEMFFSAPLSVTASSQFPLDYEAMQDFIEEGDSGGPDEVPGSTPHMIVAVNSGGGTNAEVLARVDLVSSWIQQQIMAHGGTCATPSGSGSGSSNGSSSGSSGGSTSGSSSGSSGGSTSGGSSGSASGSSGGSASGGSSGSTTGSGNSSSGSGSSGSGGANGSSSGGAAGDGGDNNAFGPQPRSSGCGCKTAGGQGGSSHAFALLGLACIAGAFARRRAP